MTTERYDSTDVAVSPLGQPLHFEFSNRTAKNRFLKAAMTERQSSWDPKKLEARGIPSQSLINTYRRWGEGGWGVIFTGNVMLDYDQLEAPGNAIIPHGTPFSGERFEAFKELATQSKKNGSLIIAQVSHPGRQAQEAVQPHPISASDVQLTKSMGPGMTFAKPRAASQEDIDRVVESFAHAAEFLYEAGYDGIELHGAHGYLLSQFLSQTTNLRTDKYGGSLANRSRIIIETSQAIRKRVPESFIVSIKINSVEFQEKGFDTEECKELCKSLEANKFDFVELSGGTYEETAFVHKRESTKKREAFFMDFADTITPALNKTKVYVTGGFKSAGAMASALKSIDGVGLGRAAAQEPHLPEDILGGKVKGAIKQQLDQQNFGLTNMAAGTQMKQVSKDQEPIDLSKESNVSAFMKDLGRFMEAMKTDTEKKLYGYIDLDLPAVPYGGVHKL